MSTPAVLALPEPYYWGRLELDEKLKTQPQTEAEFFGSAPFLFTVAPAIAASPPIAALPIDSSVIDNLDDQNLVEPRESTDFVPDLPKTKLRVLLFLLGEFSTFTDQRKSAIRDALAGLLHVPPGAIEIRSVSEGSVIFDLLLPAEGVDRLRNLLRFNDARLRLLRVQRAVLEVKPDEFETWILRDATYRLLDETGHVRAPSIPIPLHRPPRAQHFAGREEELAKLLADLQPNRVVTVCGPGGIGKTALVAEALWTLAPADAPPDAFPDGVVFHSFYDQPQAAVALESIARSYGEEPKPTPYDAARRISHSSVARTIESSKTRITALSRNDVGL